MGWVQVKTKNFRSNLFGKTQVKTQVETQGSEPYTVSINPKRKSSLDQLGLAPELREKQQHTNRCDDAQAEQNHSLMPWRQLRFEGLGIRVSWIRFQGLGIRDYGLGFRFRDQG